MKIRVLRVYKIEKLKQFRESEPDFMYILCIYKIHNNHKSIIKNQSVKLTTGSMKLISLTTTTPIKINLHFLPLPVFISTKEMLDSSLLLFLGVRIMFLFPIRI